jgi:hypothetical protein
MAQWIRYEYDLGLHCRGVNNELGCENPTTRDWNTIIFTSLYLVTLSVSFSIAIKKGHRAWWYNILILGLGLIYFFLFGFFLYTPP